MPVPARPIRSKAGNGVPSSNILESILLTYNTVVGDVALDERQMNVYECAACGELWFQGDRSCCDQPLDKVDVSAMFEPPSIEDLVREVFDISSTELANCRILMAGDEATIRELVKELSRVRSAVQRHVTHLAELGLLEQRSRNLQDGGRVNVYASRPPDELRRRLKLGLYAWMTEADIRLEELNREKGEAMIEGAEPAAADDASSTTTTQDRAVENGGSNPQDRENDRSVVARLFDRWKTR